MSRNQKCVILFTKKTKKHRLGLGRPLPAIIVYLKAINVPVNPENGIIGIFIMGRLKEAREYINPKGVTLEVGKFDACTRL